MAGLTTKIQTKTTVYNIIVTYSTFDTLLDPCDFLQTTLADSVVKDIGLLSGTLSNCLLVSNVLINNKNVYTWEVTVTV